MEKSIIVGTMRLGVWGANLDINGYQQFIETAIGLGLNHFDLADIYGKYTTEAEFGAAFAQSSLKRDEIEITTKCGIKMLCEQRPSHQIKSYDTSRAHILQSVDNSLSDLQTDYIDTLLIHRPDYLLDPAEVAEAVEDLKKAGKVKRFGVSNFTASQFDLLNSYTPLITNQIEVSLLQRAAFDDGTLNQCLQQKIRPTAWSPLGGGQLFTKNPDVDTKRIQDIATAICGKYQIELDQLLLAWLMIHPSGIIPVIGTSKVKRLASAKKAMEVNITREEWYMLWSAATGEDVP